MEISSTCDATTNDVHDNSSDQDEATDETLLQFKQNSGNSNEFNTISYEVEKGKHNISKHKHSPWKVIAKHSGTKWDHYRIIYISTGKAWGLNSKLGQNIKAAELLFCSCMYSLSSGVHYYRY